MNPSHQRRAAPTSPPRLAAVARRVRDGRAGVYGGVYVVTSLLERRRRFAMLLSLMIAIPLGITVARIAVIDDQLGPRVAVDFRQYMEATRAWLQGESFYHPWQLSAPYLIPQHEYRLDRLPVLYPPPAVVAFAGWTVVPELAPLWWAVPITVLLAAWSWWRPRPWAWPLLAFVTLHPDAVWLWIAGNPVIWSAAFLALGFRYHWPAVGVLLKPTLAPFALVGFRHKSWWAALLVVIGLSALFIPMWPDYIAAITNAKSTSSAYVLNNLYVVGLPLIMFVARSKAPRNGATAPSRDPHG